MSRKKKPVFRRHRKLTLSRATRTRKILRKIRSLAAKKGWITRRVRVRRLFKIRSEAAKKGWKTRRVIKRRIAKPPIKKRPLKKPRVKKAVSLEPCQFLTKPVRGVKNQYTVTVGDGCTDADIANEIWKQLQNKALIFRFWFRVPVSTAYAEGIASTDFRDLPGDNINSLYRVKQMIRGFPGSVFKWFYYDGPRLGIK